MVSIADVNLEYVSNLPRVDFEDRRSLPDDPGVYFVTFEVPEFKILYIGQTSADIGFRIRWASHDLIPLLRQLKQLGISTWVYYLSLPGWEKLDIKLMESAVIQKLSPVLNTQDSSKTLISICGDKWRVLPKSTFELPSRDRVDAALKLINCRLEYMDSDQLREVLIALGHEKTVRNKYSAVSLVKQILGGDYVEGMYERGDQQQPINIEAVKSRISSLDSKTIRELRRIAAHVGVNRYSYMTKTQLSQAISKLLGSSLI
jgi:hypothetical protein